MSHIRQPSPAQLRWMLPVGAALLALICLFLPFQVSDGWDFRNNLWGPAHLLSTGRSPYLIEQLFDGSNSVWMPTAIGVFYPLGGLGLTPAVNLWAAANVMLYLGLIALYAKNIHGRHAIGLLLAGLLLFPAFMSVVWLGQFGVWAALLMMLAARLVPAGRVITVALLIVVASAKPQLIVLPALGLVIGVLQHHGKASALRLMAAAAGGAALATLPLWLGYPAWGEGFMTALGRNPNWLQPSAYVLLHSLVGSFGFLLWAILAAAGVLLTVRLWRQRLPEDAMAWTLALGVLVTPYVWSWDFVLLVPLFLITLSGLRSVWLQRLLGAGFGLCVAGMLIIRLTMDNHDWRFWWMPWVLMACITAVTLLDRRRRA